MPPCLGLGTLLPISWKDKALPWDVVIHFHGAPAKDLTSLHSVVEGHTLARADAWREGETPGCPTQIGVQRSPPPRPYP